MNFLKKLFNITDAKSIKKTDEQMKESIDKNLEHTFITASDTLVTPSSYKMSVEDINLLIDDIVNDFFKQGSMVEKEFDTNDRDSLFEDAARLIVSSQSGSS
ncbi:MAG: hypothetical protein ABIP30_10260 [Ferruginibacter sp.]